MKSQPFNRYTWLTTHNSFAMMGTRSSSGALIILGTNQLDTITSQLNVRTSSFHFSHKFFIRKKIRKLIFKLKKLISGEFEFCLQNGVRGLMLDLYEFNNDIWLCHGQCSNTTAFVSIFFFFSIRILKVIIFINIKVFLQLKYHDHKILY